jgi:uncharacterized protein with HEPN domain
MSREKKRLKDYLDHILDAINRIERYVEDIDEVGFIKNELIQDAVVRNLEVVGEASRNIERDHPEFAEEHQEIPFTFAYEMRNALSHGYFKIDYEVVWKTIDRDLPELEKLIKEVTKTLQVDKPKSKGPRPKM